MDYRTDLGPITLWGQLSAPARRPVVFGIRGLFPPVDHLEWLAGALVALGAARRTPVASLVLAEPFLRSQPIWALDECVRRFAPIGEPHWPAWTEEFLETATGGLDARPLLEGLTTPTHVVMGAVPLDPRRQLTRLPSLAGEDDRALWAASPNVTTYVCEGAGHDIAAEAPKPLVTVLRRAVAEA